VVLEAAEVLARCVEVARRLGSQIPWRSGSPEYETGAAARRGERGMRQRGGEWDQEEPGRLGGAPIDGAGGWWGENRQRGSAARAPRRLEVEEGWVDLFVIVKSPGA
jgi:hypothetical protein